MQALVVQDGNLVYRSDYPRPRPETGEALVRVRLAGICATDLEIVRGYAAFQGVLGHEFVGVVEEVAGSPPAGDSWVGRRVVGGINLGCGQCQICIDDGPEHCPNRVVLGIAEKDGAFADYLTLPLENLKPVPDGVSDEMAVFTEPLAAAVRVTEQVDVKPDMATAVVGPGRLGILVAQVLAQAGAAVTVLGRSESSLELPAELGLATGLVDDAADNGFDLAVEATGNDAGLAHALRLVRPLGTLAMKSTYAGKANVDLTKLVVGEITVVGSRCGPFGPALALLEQGAITVEPLIEADYSLPQGVAALEHAARPGVRKVLLRP